MIIPVVAGLSSGVAFIVLFIVFSGHSLLPDYQISHSLQQENHDYVPFLSLGISGLRNTYKAGEGIDFLVRQIGGGDCTHPELIQIKDLDTGRVVKEWNGTKQESMSLGGRVCFETNPAISGMAWSTKSQYPIIINQTGSYAVVAKHLFKTAQKEFSVIAVGPDGMDDTSMQVADRLSSTTKNTDIVKALLEKYPNANSTISDNYNSQIFHDFQEYDPAGVVQYSVAKTNTDRKLLLTFIFDRYYEDRPSMIIFECMGKNYRSHIASTIYISASEVDKC